MGQDIHYLHRNLYDFFFWNIIDSDYNDSSLPHTTYRMSGNMHI